MVEHDPESRGICFVLVLTMSPVVIATVIEGDTFGGGSTLSLVLAAVGLVGLARQVRADPPIPRAQARHSRLRRKR